jgi:hypothetical protein
VAVANAGVSGRNRLECMPGEIVASGSFEAQVRQLRSAGAGKAFLDERSQDLPRAASPVA